MSPKSVNVCAVCVKVVLDSDEGICCDGLCVRWFHRDCMKIPRTEYTKLAGDSTLKWYCSRADCKSEDSTAELSNKLSLLISKVSDLATKEEFKEINTGISDLNKKVDVLTAKLSEFEPRLAAAEEGITKMESEIKELKKGSTAPGNEEELFAEMTERARRLRNVIVYNIPESNRKRPEDKKSHDIGMITKIYEILDLQLPNNISFFRLGKAGGRDRPIKVMFRDEDSVVTLLKRFSSETLSSADDSLSEISVGRDRTQKERQYSAVLRKQMDDRTEAGETNLTIKYLNGIPKIVKSAPKN